jgi:acyl-CoA reductase-like NAD-dependent aldehyde dehydrogenase
MLWQQNPPRTVKRLQLELGAKSASIVLDDVPEEHVAAMSILTSIIHAGQLVRAATIARPVAHLA